jgi:phospholipase C
VPPPHVDIYGLGPRVPAIIISPWARRGVTHQTLSSDSVLNLIETMYGLPRLPLQRVSVGPGDPAGNDMLSAFNFSQPPIPKLVLKQRKC